MDQKRSTKLLGLLGIVKARNLALSQDPPSLTSIHGSMNPALSYQANSLTSVAANGNGSCHHGNASHLDYCRLHY